MSNSPWQTTKSDIVYANKWMRFIKNDVIHPNGVAGEYTFLDAIPGVVVIAIEDDSIYFIREFKYPIDKWIWNLFTGGIHEGQDPLTVAKDELFSEGKIRANKWVDLGVFFFAPAIETTYNHVFLATDLTIEKFEPDGEGDEAIKEMKKIPLNNIKKMIDQGKIESGLVLGALMKFFTYAENNKINARNKSS
jgi:ADP-ribose pyrophosphatase